MISRTTIDSVFETARVEEVIGDFVQLKRAGSNLKGLSPFTDERTPSFMVSPSKQIWKDFSSGKGGNVVSFLMEHEHFTYPEAIRYLAKKYGIEIEETEQSSEEKEQANERESLYVLNEFAKNYFHTKLTTSEDGIAIGLSYFKERGFTPETIKTFELGYASNAWSDFTDHALEKGYKLEYLEKTGLTIVRENQAGQSSNPIDRFRGRVLFPIKSLSGRTLGFGGRILTTDKKTAKYLNSPESEIYHKSKILYGIYEAKQEISKADNCFLVEGYTDVIQFHQRGIKNVVSSSGTALTPEQIRLINRLTKNITLLFDGDAAGVRAAFRGVDLILEQGMNVKIVTFPEGEDPDSFARKHSLEELSEFLAENAWDFIAFKANSLAEESKNDPVRKAETIHDIIQSISKIPDLVKREVYVRECARIMEVSEEVLFGTLAQLLQKEYRESQKQKKQTQPFQVVPKEEHEVQEVDVQYELEQKILNLLILYGTKVVNFEDWVLTDEQDQNSYEVQNTTYKVFEKIYLDLQEDEVAFSNPEFKELYAELVKHLAQSSDFEIMTFINSIPPNLAQIVSASLMDEERYTLHNWEGKGIAVIHKEDVVSQLVTQTILSLRWHLINKQIDELSKDINDSDEDKDEILEEIMNYWRLRQMVAKKLHRVI